MNRAKAPPRRRIDGVLLLDKPAGITSNDALQKAKRLFNAAKAGHTGTLDPMATGLLPVCFGEATKFAGELLAANKCYDAVIRLGVRTDTADAEGRVLETRPVAVSAAEVAAALARFRGEITQIPPMHSALKRDGKPLYALARKGIEVERAPRRITIHSLDLRGFSGATLEISVECSKGTYIRTLAEDIGTALGCGAHLAALRRVGIGRLRPDAAIGLDALERMEVGQRDGVLQPVDALLADLPRVDLDARATPRFCQGQPVAAGPAGLAAGLLRAYAPGGRFLGLARPVGDGVLAPARLVAPVPPAAYNPPLHSRTE